MLHDFNESKKNAFKNVFSSEINVFKLLYINIKMRINIDFDLINKIIYHIKKTMSRLYLFVNVKKKVFHLIYDNNLHVN